MTRNSCPRDRGGVYIVVLGTAMFVTVVGLSALLMARVNTRISNANQDTVKARYYAQSLIEVGMLKAMSDSNWRTTHTNDTWVADYTWDEAVVTYKFVDENDGDLADNPTENVRLYAKATVNDAVRIYSVELKQPTASATESAEMLLSSWDPASPNAGTHNVQEWYWHGQYFEPTLPAAATSWKVTRVQFQARTSTGNTTDGVTKVQLRPANGSDHPTTTILEEFLMNETSLTSTPTWLEYTFTNVTGLSATDGLCLVLEWAQGGSAARVELDWSTPSGGKIESSSKGATWALIGTQALIYNVYGKYIISPPMTPIAGTWRREVLP